MWGSTLKHNNKGIGLLELMLSLAIIAILIIMVTRYFSPASQSQQTNDTVDMIQAIATAGQRWLLTNDTYSTGPNQVLTDFVDRNYLPDSFLHLQDAWGGPVTVTGNNPDSNDTHFAGPYLSIQMTNLTQEACNTLQLKAVSLTCGPSSDYISCQSGGGQQTSFNFTINVPSTCPSTNPTPP
jgi:type II secretory pathway pseudopilin PulG